MAKFLNTTGANYYLEELIRSANEKLILISPYLQLNERFKELLEDKNRLKIDVRIVYGKAEMQPEEISWLHSLNFIRISFCKNLHAKCYLNEQSCIITSMNLYEFSQVNNNEMGVMFTKQNDPDLYRDAHEEVQRVIRISEEVRLIAEKIERTEELESSISKPLQKLTPHRLAEKLGLKTVDVFSLLYKNGYLEQKNGNPFITDKGKSLGGEFRLSKNGSYFLWPANLFADLELAKAK